MPPPAIVLPRSNLFVPNASTYCGTLKTTPGFADSVRGTFGTAALVTVSATVIVVNTMMIASRALHVRLKFDMLNNLHSNSPSLVSADLSPPEKRRSTPQQTLSCNINLAYSVCIVNIKRKKSVLFLNNLTKRGRTVPKYVESEFFWFFPFCELSANNKNFAKNY